MPAWTGLIPLQKLIYATSRFDTSRSDFKARNAIEFAEEVAKAGSIAFDAQMVSGLKKHIDGGKSVYVAHEYLNEHWRPVFQTDLAARLKEAKLEYCATAVLVENFPKLCLTNEQQAIVDRVPIELRELLNDIFIERSFRRDIYVRGRRAIPERRRDERLRRQRLTLTVAPAAVTHKIKIPLGEAELHPRFYQPAFKALGEGVRTVGEVLDLPEAQGTTVTPQEVIGMTIGSGQALAAPNDITPAALARVRAFNLAHLKACADEGRTTMGLAGVAIGSAVTIGLYEMLVYEALAMGAAADVESVSLAILETLKRRGDRLRHEDKDLQGEAETLPVIRPNVATVLTKALPMWRRIGAI
jgi:hypothetical protein